MNRRTFAATTTMAAAGAYGLASVAGAAPAEPFKLNYAPGFRHFVNSAGKDPIDQIKFMHDNGFRGIEDNGMMKKNPALQSKIGAELARLNMTMGVFVTGFGMYSLMMTSNIVGDKNKGKGVAADPKAVRAALKKACEQAIETQKRVNAKWTTVVLGAYNPNLDEGYQFANVVDNLKYCSELFEPHGLVMVMEPLNYMNHPGVYLKTVPQAYSICKAVGSPSCKILNDLYHQQIEIGNLINNIDNAWDETAYIQVGDVPGRNEPTTGEINYKNVFKHLYDKGYKGIVGMEHGISQKGLEGEQRLIQAYREVDDFAV
ncbi:hydroxypyruvate isomerase family protein [Pontiella sulfatireligans]|uniref:Hydroxypyruvate isomerase n=1 Tax=Pontiella sulfatireligans TaxID=2750658 RepID=A0A6C2URZ5_9BACT|nr:TIM barrel protein [Pontiella sulfatireligans]VGO22723.1 Hydroxypyruvate isomerase [Pontiella sulfatireligans]